MIMESIMIPGIMMKPSNSTKKSIEQWTFENLKRKKEVFKIEAVKCVVNGKEVNVPFDAFAIHLSQMIQRLEVRSLKEGKTLYKKYPVRGLYDS